MIEDIDKGVPGLGAEGMRAVILDEPIREHLGRLLAAIYRREDEGSAGEERFAGLLARLDVALSDADDLGDAEFQTALLATAPALRRFALSLSHDADQADDLVQDAMLRAWRSRARFEPGSNLEAWVFTILRNSFYTSRRRQREVQDEDDAGAARLAVLPEQIGHLELADMQAALADLSAPKREALLLVAVQGMSYEDAAAVMGCALGTVKSRVGRAREELARALGYGGPEGGRDPLMISAVEGSA